MYTPRRSEIRAAITSMFHLTPCTPSLVGAVAIQSVILSAARLRSASLTSKEEKLGCFGFELQPQPSFDEGTSTFLVMLGFPSLPRGSGEVQ